MVPSTGLPKTQGLLEHGMELDLAIHHSMGQLRI
jgi:hypothetical protein